MDTQNATGILLLDKPTGMTSAQVLRVLKHRFKFKKIGHAGTLDPDATGLLIVLLGRATKLQSIFLESVKTYTGVIRLGEQTDTDDISGLIIKKDEDPEFVKNQDLGLLAKKIESAFIGCHQQVPPAYSAIKVSGVRSYKLAREGREVSLAPRQVEIHKIELTFIDPLKLSFLVQCSKGTYLRSLARDIGFFLGTFGCLESLRRTESTPFSVVNAYSLDDLDESVLERELIPLEAARGHGYG